MRATIEDCCTKVHMVLIIPGTTGKRGASAPARGRTQVMCSTRQSHCRSTWDHRSLGEALGSPGCHLRSLIHRAFQTPAAFPRETEELIRSELFSIEHLEQHAESLATAQHVTVGRASCRRLSRRLKANGRVLVTAYRGVEQAVIEERAITPADEWLLDNFFVAQEQIRQIREDLPAGFCHGLPNLAGGPLCGYPRVYGLAWALVAHTDSRLDRQTLIRFVSAYQRVQPLTIGELWAVAIMLRAVLI